MTDISTKTARFLSAANTNILVSAMYARHQADGGTLSLATLREQIPVLMRQWQQLPILDSYESLVYDPISELEIINQEFLTTYWPMYMAGKSVFRLPKFDRPEDYHTMDTQLSNPDRVVSDTMYRHGNKIPWWQWTMKKQLDTSPAGQGIHGRSLSTRLVPKGDMAEVLARAAESYDRTGVTDYPVDDSDTSLVATRWT